MNTLRVFSSLLEMRFFVFLSFLLGIMIFIVPTKAACSPQTYSISCYPNTVPPKDSPQQHDLTSVLSILCYFFGLSLLGIHRVIMGGKWWLIPLYIVTIGGFFGFLPLMDTVRIIVEPEHYRNNHRFLAALGFM